MRVLFDIAHPAHVHFYRYMISELDRSGHAWKIVSRDKDVTNELLDDIGLEYTSVGHPNSNWGALAAELVTRDLALIRAGHEFKPDIILTRNPAGTHAGRTLGIPSVFDTDNGRSAGVHYWAAAPFASVITTPDCFPANLGRKQIRYPSYKALAFLHPKRFTPDTDVRRRLGLESGKAFSLIRLVSMGASHDKGEKGLTVDQVRSIVSTLSEKGAVFVSSERPVPPDLASLELPTRPGDFHNVVAAAALCVGDSGSVAQEAALLGTPSIFVSTFARRVAPLQDLERRYGLISSYKPGGFSRALEALRAWDPARAAKFDRSHREMLLEKVDLTVWYLDLVQQQLNGWSRRSGRLGD